MLVKNEKGLVYMTRRIYGSMIGISVNREKGVAIYSFYAGRVREDISVPEKQEDKKVEMVISAIKELMVKDEKTSLIVELYNQKIEFFKDEDRYQMYSKIFKALIKSFGVKDNKILGYGVEKVLNDALKNGQIDVF